MSEKTETTTPETEISPEGKPVPADSEAVAEENGANQTQSQTQTTPTDEETPEAIIARLEAELEATKAEASKNLEGWQRTAADLANFKRRQADQNERLRTDITSTLLKSIFPVLDDLDLAFQNLPDSLNEQENNWLAGFELVQRKLNKVLADHQVEVIATDGEFDPNLHEAVTYEESPEHETNTIIAELRKGYKTEARVLRPALVRVAQ